MVILSVVILGLTNVYAQDSKKIVRLAPTINPQLKFSDVKIGEKSVSLDEDFDAGNNWIENLSFNLENVSDKPIVFLNVNLNFPETRTTGNLMSYGKSFGLRPGSKLKSSNEPMVLKPGETLKVVLDNEKDRIYKFINERQPVQTIHKIELEIGFVIFEDKTAWTAGAFLRQDVNDSDRYVPIKIETQR